jgi:hypothetical protein
LPSQIDRVTVVEAEVPRRHPKNYFHQRQLTRFSATHHIAISAFSLPLGLHNDVQLRLHHQLNKGASRWDDFCGVYLARSTVIWWRGVGISTLLAHAGIEVERAAKVLSWPGLVQEPAPVFMTFAGVMMTHW